MHRVETGHPQSPERDAIKRIVLCFQFAVVFPSWTSQVRAPSPAPCSRQIGYPLRCVLRLCSIRDRCSSNTLETRGYLTITYSVNGSQPAIRGALFHQILT